ncbi:MAG TPA: aspartate aminotransferase family protein [Candidatus Baltobacteraceae bacterium]|nr:aspartate aminotransferase family protein [Candidatus Baltobacteraceae bacterium]
MLLENYRRAPVTFVAGEGCELIDDRGERYLDCVGGIAVCALGHSHPAITAAVAQQAEKLVHVSNLFGHEPAATLAKELAARSGFDRVFFCNSGTEANEAAIKLARKYAHRSGRPDRKTIVSCEGGFHGRTMGALAATANAAYHEGFDPLPGGFRTTPFNDVDALEHAIDDCTAAFIVEPVQGENGVLPGTPEFVRAAREQCTHHGALLIFDEVQCGMGRTGPLFAFEHFGVQPDVVTLAKALANGLPIGAMLVREAYATGLQPGDHGSTFGGSPVPCAAALAHLRVRDESALEAHVATVSGRFLEGLRNLAQRYPGVYGEPRGMGLLIGVPVAPPHDASSIVDRAREFSGVLLNKAGGNTIRLAPPLVISPAQVDRVLETLDAAAAWLVKSSHVSHPAPDALEPSTALQSQSRRGAMVK